MKKLCISGKTILILAVLLLSLLSMGASAESSWLYDICDAQIFWSDDAIESGNYSAPQFVYHNELLTEDVHYSINTRSSNSITIQGIGSFTGTQSFDLPHMAKNLNGIGVSDQYYTGSAITPSSSAGTVQAWNNTVPGLAQARIVADGSGDYRGMKEDSFIISVKPKADKHVSITGGVHTLTIEKGQSVHLQIGTSGVTDYTMTRDGGGMIAWGELKNYGTYTFNSSKYGEGLYYFEYDIYSVYYSDGVYTKGDLKGTGFYAINVEAPEAVPTTPDTLTGIKPSIPASVGADQLYLNILPVPSTSQISLENAVWESSDPEIAVVEDLGAVTIKKPGDVTITAAYQGFTCKWEISIQPIDFEGNVIFAAYNAAEDDPLLFYKGAPLVKGVDYSVSKSCPQENVSIITVEGIGLFQGTLSRAFYNDTGYPLCSDEDPTQPLKKREYEFDGATLIEYRGNAEHVEIPYGIEKIASHAFADNNTMISVVMPDSVISAENAPFYNCTALKEIYLPRNDEFNLYNGGFPRDALYYCKYGTRVSRQLSSYLDATYFIDPEYPDYKLLDEEVLEYTGSDEVVVYPEVFYHVGGFTGNTAVREIVLPASASSINARAFENCVNLAKVSFAEDSRIMTIGNYAFSGCTALAEINLSQNNSLETIGSYAFKDCASLESIAVPAGVTNISFAFGDCTSLERVSLPASITNMNSAFSGCSSLVNINLPKGVMYVSDAFSGCTSLREIDIPAGVTDINGAFSGCASLVSVTLPAGLENISSAFSGCTSLGEIDIPEGVKELDGTFAGCSSLREVVVPDGITSVYGAFQNCTSLERVSLPSSLSSLNNVFTGCTALKELDIPEGISNIKNALQDLPALERVSLPSTLVYADYAFKNCSALKTVSFAGTLQSMEGMFYNCDALEQAIIPNGVVKAAYAFYDCDNVTQISIPSSVTNIKYAFYDCDKLESITIPAGITEASYAFAYCDKLTTANLSEGLESIEYGVFHSCPSLKDVVVPESVTTIGNAVFLGCTSLKRVFLGDSISHIDNLAFDDELDVYPVCNKDSVTMQTIMDSSVFRGFATYDNPDWAYNYENDSLVLVAYLGKSGEVVVPEDATDIEGLFRENADITGITIPESITVIPEYCFYNCTGLKKVVLPETLTEIGDYAFYGCSSLSMVQLPDNLTGLYTYSFPTKTGLVCTAGSATEALIFSLGMSIVNPEYPHWTYVVDELENGETICRLTGYIGPDGEVEVPEFIQAIGSYAFSGNSSITSLVLHDGILRLEDRAFYGIRNLESVHLAGGSEYAGKYLFENCSKLKNVTFDESFEVIPEYAFNYCSALTEIEFTQGVKTIGSEAFRSCGSLKKVTTCETLETIGDYAFYECASLADVNLAEGLKTIGSFAFYECALEEIVIPEGVTEIGTGAFEYCRSLADVSLPSTLTTIKASAFYYCTALAEIDLPQSLTYIEVNAYRNTGLEEVVLPDNLSYLGGGRDVFDSSCKLYANLYSNTASIMPSFLLEDVPEIKLSQQKGEDGDFIITLLEYNVNEADVTIPDYVNVIGSRAFYGNQTLVSLTVPEGVTAIGDYAFYACDALEEVSLPESGLVSIGEDAFRECIGLEEIVIPEGITELPYGVFYACDNLVEVHLPSTLLTIGSSCFHACPNLKYVELPDNLTSYGSNTFYTATLYANPRTPASELLMKNNGGFYDAGDHSLYLKQTKDENGVYTVTLSSYAGSGALVVPDYVDVIGNQALSGEKITSAVIPDSVKEIGKQAFYNCTVLESVRLPEGLESISDSTFYGCSALSEITIPEGVVSIGSYAFYDCSSLKKAVIPEGVTSIGRAAFYGCTSLMDVSLPSTLREIDNQAFYNCASLKSIDLPDNLETCGDQAFSGSNGTVMTIPCANLGSATAALLTQEDGYFNAIGYPGLRLRQDVDADGESIISLSKYAGSDAEVVIPDFVDVIDSRAFMSCTGVTGVVIPEGITQIPQEMFNGCTGLVSVEIPASVKEIGSQAFYKCSSLAAIDLPVGIETINYSTFYGCTSLSEVIIPGTVTTIGQSAFEGCTSLTEITIPEGVTEINYHSFYGCRKLEKLSLPEGLVSIGGAAFYDTALKEVMLPDNLTELGSNAFDSDCVLTCNPKTPAAQMMMQGRGYFCAAGYSDFQLKQEKDANGVYTITLNKYTGSDAELTIPGFVDVIGEQVFYNNASLTSVVISEGVKEIVSRAFSNCGSLISVDLPDSLTKISASAFYSCGALTEITIPAAVTAISNSAFRNCSALTKVSLPEGLEIIDTYAFASCTSLAEIDLPESVKEIGDVAFYGCKALKEIAIPEGVTEIPNQAFQYCSGLEAVSLPNSLLSIGGSAFDGCSSLTELVIPEGVTRINAYSFMSCSKLEKLTLPEGLTSIGYAAFSGCSNLAEVALPDNLTELDSSAFNDSCVLTCNPKTPAAQLLMQRKSYFCAIGYPDFQLKQEKDANGVYTITLNKYTGSDAELTIPGFVDVIGEQVFYNNASLTSVVISEGVKEIVSWAFSNCGSLISIDLPDSLTKIGYSAFSSCGALTEITIPAAVTAISNSAFRNCSALTKVSLPEGLEIIDTYAFESCTSLAEINLPESVKEIGDIAFYGCKALKEITIPKGVTKIGSQAFHYCSGLEAVTLPNSLLSIGQSAFEGCTSLGEIDLPAKLETIGQSAFRDTALTEIILPDNLTSVSSNSFPSQTSIFCNADSASAKVLGSLQFAEPGKPDLRYQYREDKIVLVKYSGDAQELTIPEFVEKIGREVFYNNKTLTNVILPDSVTAIDSRAFLGCSGLKQLILHDNVREIGSDAFGSSTVLCNKNSATAFTLAENAMSFAEIEAPELIYLRTNHEDGSYSIALKNYTGSAEELVLPNFVAEIKEHAFSNNTTLKRITLPEGLTSIGSSAFWGCTALTEITLPEGLASIGSSAFRYCNALAEVTLPEGLTSVGYQAFYSCTSLAEVILPESLTSIGAEAFAYCSSLAEIILPDNIGEIGSSAFGSSTVLCNMDSVTAFTLAENAMSFAEIDAPELIYQRTNHEDGSYSVVLTKYTGSAEELILPDFVAEIKESAFSNNKTLTRITLPEGLTSIGSSAFYDCSALAEVTLPEGLTSIGSSAFYSSTIVRCNLSKAEILADTYITFSEIDRQDLRYQSSSDDSSISICLVKYAGSGEEVVVPDFVDQIGSAFYNNTTLKRIVLPEGIESIGRNAFYGCSALTELNLPDSITTIEQYAIYDCDSLVTLTIPAGVTELKSYTVAFCDKMQSVVIGKNVQSMDSSAIVYSAKDAYVYRGTAADSWAQSAKLNIFYLDDVELEDYLTIYTDLEQITADKGTSFNWRSRVSCGPVASGKQYGFAAVSADPSILQVDGDLLRFMDYGSTTLTISIAECPDVKVEIPVTAYLPVEEIIAPEAYLLKNGTYVTLRVLETVPAEHVNPEFIWEFDTNVYLNGKAASSLGTATSNLKDATQVTITAASGVSVTVPVVCYDELTKFEAKMPAAFMESGETMEMYFNVTVDGKTYDEGCCYLSDTDPEITRIEDGRVVAVADGSSAILAKLPDGSTAEMKVTVGPLNRFFLPSAMRVIQEEAFMGMTANAVHVSENCVSIGARAFANAKNLQYVYIASAETQIDPTAFENSPSVIICAPANSAAQAFAAEYGVFFRAVDPMDP